MISEVNISEVKTNPNNPRLIKDGKFKKLVQSIKDFPQMLKIRPIVVNQDNVVLGGNMRLKACQEAGLKKVWIIKADDLTEEQQSEFIIKDNVGFGEWDWDILANEWDTEKLEEWGLDGFPFEVDTAESEEDNYEEPEDIKLYVVLGDLIEIGQHRLLCGDSTDADQVAKLMNGDKWQLLATSPPYNQGNAMGNLLHTKGLGTGKKDVKLYQDKNQDNRTSDEYFKFLISILNICYLFRDEKDHTVCWNIAYNAKSRDDYGKIIFSDFNPFSVKETIIWDKGHSINLPQIGIYSRRCEFVFVMTSNEKYRTSQVYNDCRWNYWQIKSAGSQITGESVEHRATYPVEFAFQMISDFSHQHDFIYDPFLGSGTTMVASQQLGRKCYGIEIDPKYCQIIIDRMQKLDPSLEIKINGKIYEQHRT